MRRKEPVRGKSHVHWVGENILARQAAFRTEYIHFERGIQVGHLDPSERITRILKGRLEEKHGVRMLCDRYGRGVYWQWICWVPEPNRKAKPLSSKYNFGSTKFFIAVEKDDRIFQAGMQIERAPKKPDPDDWPLRVEKDWDWHVLLRALRGGKLPRLIAALLKEGFRVRAGAFSNLVEYTRKNWDSRRCLRRAGSFPANEWGGFQLFWPMTEEEVSATPGPEMVEAILAVFDEIAPLMQLCMYAPCLRESE